MNISGKTCELAIEVSESNPLLGTTAECRIKVEGNSLTARKGGSKGRMKRIFLPPFSGILLK
jgi:hypothetical protein